MDDSGRNRYFRIVVSKDDKLGVLMCEWSRESIQACKHEIQRKTSLHKSHKSKENKVFTIEDTNWKERELNCSSIIVVMLLVLSGRICASDYWTSSKAYHNVVTISVLTVYHSSRKHPSDNLSLCVILSNTLLRLIPDYVLLDQRRGKQVKKSLPCPRNIMPREKVPKSSLELGPNSQETIKDFHFQQAISTNHKS